MSCPTLVGDDPISSGQVMAPISFTDGGTKLWGNFSGVGVGWVPYPALTPVTLDGRGALQAVDEAEDGYAITTHTSPAEIRVVRVAPGGAVTTLYTDNAEGNNATYTLSLHPTDGQLYGLRLSGVTGVVEGLYRFDPAAGGRTTIATGLDAVGKAACTEGYVWWPTDGGSISRVPVGGGSVQTVSVGWTTGAMILAGVNDEVLVVQNNMAAYWLVDASMTVTPQSCTDFGSVLGTSFATRDDFGTTAFGVTGAFTLRYLYEWPGLMVAVSGWHLGKAGSGGSW